MIIKYEITLYPKSTFILVKNPHSFRHADPTWHLLQMERFHCRKTWWWTPKSKTVLRNNAHRWISVNIIKYKNINILRDMILRSVTSCFDSVTMLWSRPSWRVPYLSSTPTVIADTKPKPHRNAPVKETYLWNHHLSYTRK